MSLLYKKSRGVPMAQKGRVIMTSNGPTSVYTPEMEAEAEQKALEAEYSAYASNAQYPDYVDPRPAATITQTPEPQGAMSKMYDGLVNPMTALSYATDPRKGTRPDYLNRLIKQGAVDRNNLDIAVDTFNPFSLADFVSGFGSGTRNGDYLIDGMRAVSAIPMVRGAAGLFRPGSRVISNIFNSVPSKLGNTAGSWAKPVISKSSWERWNKEIPNNKALLNEYSRIERMLKLRGKWMKYSDGTKFKGTPEQFIQMNSKGARNFAGGKKEAENIYKNIKYRGSNQYIDDFVKRDSDGAAVFTTDNIDNARAYAKGNEYNRIFHPDKDFKYDWNSGIYELGIPGNTPTVKANGKNSGWRLLDYDKRIADNTLKKNYVAEHNDYLNSVYKDKKLAQYNLLDYNPNKKYMSTDTYANYVKNPKNKETVAEIKDVVDTMGERYTLPTTVHAIDAKRTAIKSLRHNNGMFDKNNTNIYKSLAIPAVIGSLLKGGIQEYKKGGLLYKNNRQ